MDVMIPGYNNTLKTSGYHDISWPKGQERLGIKVQNAVIKGPICNLSTVLSYKRTMIF